MVEIDYDIKCHKCGKETTSYFCQGPLIGIVMYKCLNTDCLNYNDWWSIFEEIDYINHYG